MNEVQDYWKGEVFAYVGRNQNLKDLRKKGGYSKVRTHTVLGPYGRSVRTSLRAVSVVTFE